MLSAARVAGMDGEPASDAIVAYLSRLTGEDVSPDRPVRLRSVQRAAFASWSRKQDMKLSFGAIKTGVPFHIQDLFGGNEDALPVRPAQQTQLIDADRPQSPLPAFSIGIDIEEVGNLPQADDYREHPFYRDNFTPGEIAHCIRQSDVRGSLCGTWAAKEALIKSGLASAPLGRLNAIEITHDDAGRPGYPKCRLSISHTAATAVAVCVAFT
jgi:phosphopantetheine--protein transferase-like protein